MTTKIECFRARPGKAGQPRHYWEPSPALRRAGYKVHRLSDDYAEAVREAAERNAEVARWRDQTGGADKPRVEVPENSVRAMIIAFQSSRFWPKNKNTRRNYLRHLAQADAWIGALPAKKITAPMVQTHYGLLLQTGRPFEINSWMRTLRRLFSVGRLLGFVDVNPVEKPGLEKAARQVEPIIWSDAQIAAIVETADALGRYSVGTAVTLNHWLGQRPADVLALTSDSYRDGSIRLTQGKTGRRVELPVDVVEHLGRRIQEEAARVEQLLADKEARRARRNRAAYAARVVARIGAGGVVSRGHLIVSEERGTPYTTSGFAHLFEDIRAEAARRHPDVPDLGKLRFVWLRHTAVTRMAEAGSELQEIAAISGHTLKSVTQIIEHYLVRTGKMARAAFERRVAAAEAALCKGKVLRVGTPVAVAEDDF